MAHSCIGDDKKTLKKMRENLPQEKTIYNLAEFYKVFADSTRIKMLSALLGSELCVGDLAELLQMTQSAISHQLRLLKQNGVVKFRKEGKHSVYSLDDSHIEKILNQGLEHVYEKI